MKQNDWKIIYTNYDKASKRAVNFLSKEMGKLIIREPDVYRIYILPCEKEPSSFAKNTLFIGLYDDSAAIKSFVSDSEVPNDGFLVKVIKNPMDADGRFVILTAKSEEELFYAAVSFIDDYIPQNAPRHGSNRMPDLIFDSPIPECYYTDAPLNKTRSIFTWGHSINDYRSYIDNMARLKFNQLIIWNDFVPINISDVIDYAHSYSIKVHLGYSWGWIVRCTEVIDISDSRLTELKNEIITEYETNYKQTGCDGIYFQTFTERKDEYIGNRLTAEAATTLVNMTAKELLSKYPTLKLQFGLHASSVRTHLEEIEKVDERVEILWEDCGEFPYAYTSFVCNEEIFKETLTFTQKILALRGGKGVGLVFKGVMMLNWNKFVNQSGPYVMGENAKSIIDHDKRIRSASWRIFSGNWMQSTEKAAEMFKFINDNRLLDVNMCIAGTFDGGIYLPFAVTAELFRNPERLPDAVLKKVIKRPSVTLE